MRLLDPSIVQYVLSGKTWRVGAGRIENETGETVGYVKRKQLPVRTEIQILDIEESVLCVLRRKTAGLNPVYDVADANGRHIGRAKRAIDESKGFMTMYATNDEEMLKATGSAVRWQFTLKSPKRGGRDCATLTRAGCWEQRSHPSPQSVERYVIDIDDPDTDRLLLLAYAIAISDAALNT